jgi:hypothetical protein
MENMLEINLFLCIKYGFHCVDFCEMDTRSLNFNKKWLGLVTGTRSVTDGEMYPHEPFFVYIIVNA